MLIGVPVYGRPSLKPENHSARSLVFNSEICTPVEIWGFIQLSSCALCIREFLKLFRYIMDQEELSPDFEVGIVSKRKQDL